MLNSIKKLHREIRLGGKTKLLLIALLIVSCFNNVIAQAPSIQWQKSLGGSANEVAYSIQQTSDGGYIVAGAADSNDGDVTGNHGYDDCWILKLSSAGSIQWQKSLGGSDYDDAAAIQQTTDGGYIVGGVSRSVDGDATVNHGANDYWIVKLDSLGNIQWQKSLGGSNDDYTTAIDQTNDGGYIVAGYSRSTDGDVTGNHGNYDYWIVKLGSAGNMLWQKSLGGSSNDYANAIQQTTDGGYIVSGGSASTNGDVTGNHGYGDYWILKLDSLGNIQWQKSLGGSGDDVSNAIELTTDGGYIVAGFSTSTDGDVTGNHGSLDFWIMKLDSTGSIQWQKSLGGSSNDEAWAVRQTTDGGYIVEGLSSSTDGNVTGNHGSDDYWTVKLSGTGNIQWQKSFGGSSQDHAYAIQQTTDAGYIVAGTSNSIDGDVTGNHGGGDYWIVKLSPQVGIHELSSSENLFSIYPNPCANRFTLSFNIPVKTGMVKIFNVMGEEVYSVALCTSSKQEIETGNLAKGVYFVQVHTVGYSSNGVKDEERLWVEKIVVD